MSEDFSNIKTYINLLKEHVNTNIEDITKNKTLNEAYDIVYSFSKLMYGTKQYKDIYNSLKNDKVNVKPGTIGEFLYGCMINENSCNPSCYIGLAPYLFNKCDKQLWLYDGKLRLLNSSKSNQAIIQLRGKTLEDLKNTLKSNSIDNINVIDVVDENGRKIVNSTPVSMFIYTKPESRPIPTVHNQSKQEVSSIVSFSITVIIIGIIILIFLILLRSYVTGK
jgi:hypothetical protein